MLQIPIFVINLKRSEERRTRVQEALDSLGLAYEFIEAVDGNDFSDGEVAEIQAGQSDWSKRLSAGRPILRGEIGCALSHLKAYEKVVHENLDYACILEDDMIVDQPRILQHLLQRDNLLALDRKRPFDFIYLFVGDEQKKDMLCRRATALPKLFSGFWAAELAEGASLCKPIVVPVWGSVGYIVNKRACDVLLTEGRPVRVPSDHLAACAELMGIRQYFINPLPITHDGYQTSEVDPDAIRHPLGRKAACSGQSKAEFRGKVSIMIKATGLINHKLLVRKNVLGETWPDLIRF